MSDLTIAHFVIGGYLVAMLGIGIYAAHRTESSDDFLVAGRNLSLGLCSATLMATWFGSATVIGAAGAAYKDGMLGVIADPFGAGVCLLLAGMFYMRTVRRMRLLTITDFFEIKYGLLTGMLASIAMFALYVGWTAAQLVGFGLVVKTLFGTSATTGMVVGTAVILAYTTAGGMWAVALTDFVQVIIITLGLLLILPIVVHDAGGWSTLAERFPEHSFRLIPVEPSGRDWLEYVRAWTIIGLGSIATQDLMQRAFAARNENIAQNSAYIAATGYLTIGMIPVVLGIIGGVTLPGLENEELVVPELAIRHLHAVPMAIFVGALLAAIMSSADSALLAPASLLSANIVPYFSPSISQGARFRWARYSVPVIGLAALGVALWAQTVYELFLDAFAITLVALFVPFTSGIWWRRANRYGALAAIVSGTAVWLVAPKWWPDLPSDLLGLGASLAAMLIVTPLSQRADPPRPLQDRDGNSIDLRDRLGVATVGPEAVS